MGVRALGLLQLRLLLLLLLLQEHWCPHPNATPKPKLRRPPPKPNRPKQHPPSANPVAGVAWRRGAAQVTGRK